VSLVLPDSDISSYRLVELAHVVLVYTSTIGLESALQGKPVVVAGQTHYRSKGFTLDPRTRDEYFDILQKVLAAPPDTLAVDIQVARRYAYLFFGRYMFPFPLIDEPQQGETRLRIGSLDELRTGQWPELDAICDFILQSYKTYSQEALLGAPGA
jgi:capsule polysaccharide export protein KpsC/LpsZ